MIDKIFEKLNLTGYYDLPIGSDCLFLIDHVQYNCRCSFPMIEDMGTFPAVGY